MQTGALSKVVFIDRDGVINRDSPDYIKSWEEFVFLPGSLGAFKRLTESGFAAIVITNQSAVGRRLISMAGLKRIHRKMKMAVQRNGGFIRDIYFCPHTPEAGCDCRKPKPGLICRAQQEHGIDLSKSYMVGDSAKDIECAHNAGCGCAILVMTGNGSQAREHLSQKGVFPDYVASDLLAAVDWIIRRDRR
jgi:D-glycero-D-manno-heptose 1,7-bisphosphate phosphatase